MEGETVIAGVDTHKDVHVLCLLDGLGRKIWSGSFGADPEGYDRLAEAIGDPGSCMVVGVEGTASYGAGLTRRLVELGYNVVEVLRPKRDKVRPGEGKSDPLDAERAARKAASGKGCSVPKSQDGWVEAVRQLYVARRLAVATSTSCVACAKSMLTTAPSALRERFRGRSLLGAFMEPFRGVSTKHLDAYLAWFRWCRTFMATDSGAAGRTVARQLAHGVCRSRVRDMFNVEPPYMDYWAAPAA